METDVKFAVAVLAAVVLFAGGYRYAAAVYKAEIESMKARAEKEAREYADDDKERLLEQRDTYARATSVLLKQMGEAESSRRDLAVTADRLRKQLAASSARLSAPGDAACRVVAERLAGCERLLSEGVGLAEEGARLVERGAIRKDGLAAYSVPIK